MGNHHLPGGRGSSGHQRLAPQKVRAVVPEGTEGEHQAQELFRERASDPEEEEGDPRCLNGQLICPDLGGSPAGRLLRDGDDLRDRARDPTAGEQASRPSEIQEGAPPISREATTSCRATVSPGSTYEHLSVLSNQEIQFLRHHPKTLVCESWKDLVDQGRLCLMEVCCEPDSVLSSECEKLFGVGSAYRIAHWNGGDIETYTGRQHIRTLLREKRPRVLWISPECGPYSPMQHLNQRTPEQRKQLKEKRRKADLQYEGACMIAKEAHEMGCMFVLELSERCEGWNHSCFSDLARHVPVFEAVCKGCQVSLRDSKGKLLGKGWKLQSNNRSFAEHMNLRCSGDHEHGTCEGSKTCRSTAFYTPEFVKRALKLALSRDNYESLLGELCDGVSGHAMAFECVRSCEEADSQQNEDPSEQTKQNGETACVLSREERNQALQNIKRIHSATGHCSRNYLYKALKKRGVSEEVCRLVNEFECDVCQENVKLVPRNRSTLSDIPPKWTRVQFDGADWQHPNSGETVHMILGIDEGSRFRVGGILHEGKNFSPSAKSLISFFESHWQPVFGQPVTIRLDPAGAFRSKELDDYFSNRQIMVDTIPGEAHWQNGIIERCVQFTKKSMSALAAEFPEMKASELLSRSLWAQNTHDQYLGFSPLQHAFGRNPDITGRLTPGQLCDTPVLTESGISAEFGENTKAMIEAEKMFFEEQNKERLRRALDSGHRQMRQVTPGDLVFYWRYQVTKNHGSSAFKRGKYLGPARVLAVETRKESDGSARASSIVWLVRGNKLLKAAPQQIRPASPREKAWAELEDPHQPLSWTISDILDKPAGKTYENILEDWNEFKSLNDLNDEEYSPSLPDDTGDHQLEQQEIPMDETLPMEEDTTTSIREQQIAPPQPYHPERKRQWEAPRFRAKKKTKGVEVVPEEGADIGYIQLAAEDPSSHLLQEHACLSIEIDLPSGPRGKQKSWIRDFTCFVTNQIKKNHVEVNERFLSEEEKKLFAAAKHVEVKNFVLAKVFEQLPKGVRPDRSQALRMRWVLTWKINPDTHERKAKARAVILGFLDPEYERRPSASPTVSRTSRQLFLQMARSFGFSVEKGDVSGAFLQGRRFNREILCEPLPEICKELNLPEGSVTRLTRAAYGLVS